MGWTVKRFVAIGLVGAAVVLGPRIHMDAGALVSAFERTPVKYTHFYTGPDNMSHIQEIPFKLTTQGKGASMVELTEPIKATRWNLSRTPPDRIADLHNASKLWVINIRGRQDFDLSDGTPVPHYPGHIAFFDEEEKGKGHVSHGLGHEDRIAIFVYVP